MSRAVVSTIRAVGRWVRTRAAAPSRQRWSSTARGRRTRHRGGDRAPARTHRSNLLRRPLTPTSASVFGRARCSRTAGSRRRWRARLSARRSMRSRPRWRGRRLIQESRGRRLSHARGAAINLREAPQAFEERELIKLASWADTPRPRYLIAASTSGRRRSPPKRRDRRLSRRVRRWVDDDQPTETCRVIRESFGELKALTAQERRPCDDERSDVLFF